MTPEQAASIITTLTQQLAQAEAALDDGREALRAANEQVRRADDEVARAEHFIERNRARAEKAEAALDRVRALCLPGRASVWIADLRAAIDGVSE